MSLALWMVALGGLLPIVVVLIAKADPALDVHNPRELHIRQTGMRKRAYGAHLNGLEAFPLFAAAVLSAQISGASQIWIDLGGVTWSVVRIAYTVAYLGDLARLRAGLWALSVAISTTIFLIAGLD